MHISRRQFILTYTKSDFLFFFTSILFSSPSFEAFIWLKFFKEKKTEAKKTKKKRNSTRLTVPIVTTEPNSYIKYNSHFLIFVCSVQLQCNLCINFTLNSFVKLFIVIIFKVLLYYPIALLPHIYRVTVQEQNIKKGKKMLTQSMHNCAFKNE